MSQNLPYYVGLLSGTSMDAIDAGLWAFGEHKAQLIYGHQAALGPNIKEDILKLTTSGQCSLQTFGKLDCAMGHLFANAVNELLKKANIPISQVAAIGSHGQTLWHEPTGPYPFTIQIGDANVIAQKTQVTTVADFRRADLALGGQGAPLVPAFHQWLFQSEKANRVIVNIGGISNISILPKDLDAPIVGYDTGPGNTLLDAWCKKHTNQPYDKDGAMAQKGIIIKPLLEQMLQEPFFGLPFPKSTGTETFNLNWLEPKLKSDYKVEDVQATLVALTSKTIASSLTQHVDQAEIYVCGGGVHNQGLMNQLKRELPKGLELKSIDNFGIHPDWIESALFAWLAKQRLEGQTINLSQFTGASANALLGGVFMASDMQTSKTHANSSIFPR